MQALTRIIKEIVFFTLLFGLGIPCFSQAPSQEYQIKGAYILNFSRFTQWPEKAYNGSENSFIISILGKDPFGVFLDELIKDESNAGRPIIVKRLKSLEETEVAHILFISREYNIDPSQLDRLIKDQSILTISDREGFARRGGIVEFYVEDDKVKFVINQARGEQCGLHFSSKLLRLAKICCN